MKKTILCGLGLALAVLLAGYPIQITSWDIKADLAILNRLGVSVDNVKWDQGSILADIRDDLIWDQLLSVGLSPVKLPDLARELALRIHADKSTSAPKDEYYTIDQYHQFMQDTAAQYPNLCSLINVGSSVQNRPIYFLQITDNPGVEEAEPEFKYISSMHGNEFVGYDMCIRLIQLLTSAYGTDARITNLVNSTEIWICPLMNPDGYVLGQRYNAAGVDLNRNFPLPTGIQHPDGNAWAPETIAVMDFCSPRSFNLSANFHCGALVMNYPWDYTYNLAPDDALFQAAALTYSIHNAPMYNSSDFPQGITNGAQWYVATGTMQDWNYGFTNCFDITAEISEAYAPPASTLPTFWAQNQESMLSYMEFVHKGIHGTVSSSTGIPLAASITVQGNAKLIRTDPDAGDYHRMLLPGDYILTAQAHGYLPQTAQITVPTLGTVTHDFVLEPAQSVSFFGQARDLQGLGLSDLELSLSTDPPLTATTDANGCFNFAGVLEGLYQITFSQNGTTLQQSEFLLTAQANRHVFVLVEPTSVWLDTCDSMQNWTANTPWGLSTYLGESVITDSPAGNYANNAYRSIRLIMPISLQNIDEPVLTFKAAYDLESGYDFILVMVSNTLSNWVTLDNITGSQADWEYFSYSLQQFAGQSVYIRFVLDSDYSISGDGIYLDDIGISGIPSDAVVYGDATGERIVNQADAQAILDYRVGLDPLPEIDPLPWSALRITACDVDENEILNSADAALVWRYLLDPSFRFEAQSGAEASFAGISFVHTQNGGTNQQQAEFDFTPGPECLEFTLLPASGVEWLETALMPVSLGMSSYNQDECKYAWVAAGQGSPDQLRITYQTALAALEFQYSFNTTTGTLNLVTGTSNPDELDPAPAFALAQNYPNPFNPGTVLVFSLPSPSQTSLRIYNAKGQLVATLVDGVLEQGSHRLSWNGMDNQGQAVSSGVYFYKLQSGALTQTRRMLLIK